MQLMEDKYKEINELLSRAFTYDRDLEIPSHLQYGRIPPLPPVLQGYMEFHK